MDKRIRVGAVSYLNTKPLLYGIKRSGLMNRIDLLEDYPSKIASMLLKDEIDLGLIPVAVIPSLKEAHIVSDYCISTERTVASVALFSEVPMESITTVLLDYQSRTSVNLARILLKEYWKKDVELKHASTDFRSQIKGTTAGVVIGDRALDQKNKSTYMYDLGEAWNDHTGLPFVFAAWVSNKPIDADFIEAFNLANAYGFRHLDEVIAEQDYVGYDLKKYFTENIDYLLTEKKREGLALFLQKLNQFPALL